MKDTKTRILDAAERILAEHGFAGCSLRAVTASAGVNLGSVNYHFQSKESLIQAVIRRRLVPLNRERLAALDACEARAAGREVALADLLHALLDPMFRGDSDGTGFLRLIGRIYTEPTLDFARLFRQELDDVVRRFWPAFHRTLPDLEPEVLFWRVFFTIGAMAHVLAGGAMLQMVSGGICDPNNAENALRQLVLYAEAGLRAPAVRQRKKAPAHPRPAQ
jgi:AcrR family transcriptional regulator